MHTFCFNVPRKGPDLPTLFRRFYKVAAPYWFSDDKVQARIQLASVFALTLGTTGISVGFNFLGRDFYNALANKDQEQFTTQLSYYLAAFAGGIPIFVIRDYARETLALRWRSWMTNYYMERYLKNQTFYQIQSQSIIDNPDQRIVDDLSSFIGTSLSFSLTLFNAMVDLISFSNILFGIYPPLFVVLLVYSLGGIAISIFLGKGLVNLNFMQEKMEADFRYGLVRIRENAESIAFYGGEENEIKLLLQRFRNAFLKFNSKKSLLMSLTVPLRSCAYISTSIYNKRTIGWDTCPLHIHLRHMSPSPFICYCVLQ
ncbi:putative ABC-type fatty-acyl-CoA transporter [Helianthus debilis subsp. tardiflorus]